MSKIKLNLSRLSIPEKIARAREIIKSLTGNPDFPSPFPTLATMKAVTDDLETTSQDKAVAKQAAEAKTAAQNEKEDTFDRTFAQVAAHVESVAGDSETMIKSAGMSTKAVAVSSTEKPPPPISLNITAGDTDGEIDLSWEPAAGARSYQIEQSLDPPTKESWSQVGASTKSSKSITGLTSGTRYWFRVAAVATAGQSGWSDPATKIAP